MYVTFLTEVMNLNYRPNLQRFRGLARLLTILLFSVQLASAGLNDCRGLYSFSDSLASRWPVQPALENVGFSTFYSADTIGGVVGSKITVVPALGPSQSLRLINWARNNGSFSVGPCNSWTLAMDIKPTFTNGPWLSILQTNLANTDDSEFALNADGSLYADGQFPVPAGTFQAAIWQRLVVTCDGSVPANGLTLRFFRNGVLVGTLAGRTFDGAYAIGAKAALFADDNNETNLVSVNGVAFWTERLLDTVVTGFGSPKGAVPEFSWAGMLDPAALPGLEGKVDFGGFLMDLPASGFSLGDGSVFTGSGLTVPGAPGYGLGGTLAVRLSGTRLFYTGAATLALPDGPPFSLANVVVSVSGATVGPTGAVGTMLVFLPVGMGAAPTLTSRRLRNSASAGLVGLQTGFFPTGGAKTLGPSNFGGGSSFFMTLEEMPVRYELSQITWVPSSGAFLCSGSTAVTFDRQKESRLTKEWNQYAGVIGDERLSNDDSFSFVSGRSGDLIVDALANGQAKIRSLNLSFTTAGVATGYKTHFPKGLQIHWSTGGSSQLIFTNGTRQANSYLYEGLETQVDVPRDAPGNAQLFVRYQQQFSQT